MFESTQEIHGRLLAERKKGVRIGVFDTFGAINIGEREPTFAKASDVETVKATHASDLNTGNVAACEFAVYNRHEPFVVYMTKMKPYYIQMCNKRPMVVRETSFVFRPPPINPCSICCTSGPCNPRLHFCAGVCKNRQPSANLVEHIEPYFFFTNYWGCLSVEEPTLDLEEDYMYYMCPPRNPETNRRRQPHELFGYYAGGPVRRKGDYQFYPNRRYKARPNIENKPGRKKGTARAVDTKDNHQHDIQGGLNYHIQSEEDAFEIGGEENITSPENSDDIDMFRQIHEQLASVVESGQVPDFHVKLMEDLLIFSYSVYKARDLLDFTVAVIVLFKLRTNGSVISHVVSILKKICGVYRDRTSNQYEIQASSRFTWFIDALKSDTYREIVRILTILCGLFMMFGNELFTLDIFDRCEKMFKFSPIISGTNIFVDIVSTLSSIYSKFVAFVETGDINDFFDTSSNVKDFCDRVYNVDRVSKNFTLMSSMFDKDGVKWTFHSFAHELSVLLDRAPHIRAVVRGSSNFVKENVNRKIQLLSEVKESFDTFLSSQKFRPAPFSLLIFGGTSIGKSSIVRYIQELHAKMAGLPAGQEYCYTLNPHDKYMSGFGTHHHTLVLDDIAVMQSKKQSEGDPQLNILMRVVNNVTFTAPQADVDSKGKIPVKVELVVGTTNVKTLDAHAYCNVPSAVLRRFPFIVSPSVRPEFSVINADDSVSGRLDPGRVDGSNDYYTWTVEEVIPRGNNIKYNTILENVPIKEFIRWLDAAVSKHRASQERVMTSSEEFVNVPMCDVCGKIRDICICVCPQCAALKDSCTCPYQQQSLVALARNWVILNIITLFLGMLYAILVEFFEYLFRLFHAVTFVLRVTGVLNHYYQLSINRIVQFRLDYERLCDRLMMRIRLWRQGMFWRTRTITYNRNRVERNHRYAIPAVLSIITAGAIGYHFYSRSRRYEQQGGENSKMQMFAPDTDADKRNFYTQDLPKGFPIQMTQASRATSIVNIDDVKKMIRGNMYHVTVSANGRYAKANAIFIKGNFLVLNNHVVLSDDCNIKFNHCPKNIHTLNEVTIHSDAIYRLPDLDICVIRLNKLPMHRDISHFLLKDVPDTKYIFSGEMYMVPPRAPNDTTAVEFKTFKIKSARFCDVGGVASNQSKLVERGFKCVLDQPTVNGDCGSISVFNMDSEGNGLIIAGLHHAGSGCNTVTTHITKDVFDGAVKFLTEKAFSHVNEVNTWHIDASVIEPIVDHDVCRIGSERRHVDVNPIHPKCPLHWINEGTFSAVGSHTGIRDSNLESRIRDFPLRSSFQTLGYNSEKVAPRLSGWEIHRKALLETVSENTMSESILNYVTATYIKDVIKRVPDKEFRYLKKLDDYSAVNGVANFNYVDSLVMNTSAGWPFSQKKINYFQMCEPRDGHQCAYEPIPELQRRIDNINAAYAEGKRAFIVWKAFTKDEPISKAKYDEHRTRHLFCSPVDFSIVTRKYLLTLARLMQRNQFAFETAMGIVAQSSEWSALYKYLTAHPNNIFGDYVSYDKTMNLSVMRSVFTIIKVLCHHSGNYSPEDILAISCIEEDTACPLVDFFGDLIMFPGMNPSGSPLTTMINCLANCLYMRYAFIVCAENVGKPRELVLKFRDYVNLITYGDDNGMCVSNEIPWFTHQNLKFALKSVGVGYTTPDKDKEGLVDYLDINESDFLSRGFVYNADVEGFLAPLSHKSMSKMVCHYLKSANIPEVTQILSILKAFVFESFFHGREIYERNLTFCQSIIESHFGIFEEYPTWEEQVYQWKLRSSKFARVCFKEA